MTGALRIHAKLTRFEILTTAVVCGLVAVWAVTVIVRLNGVGAPAECIDGWLARLEAGTLPAICAAPMRAWSEVITSADALIEGQGPIPLSAMGVLPFLLGVLCGVPIIGRELESRTAQTAWSLEPSRLRWLGRSATPVALVLLLGTVIAAIVVHLIVIQDVASGTLPWTRTGVHGPLVVVRAFAAFGIGLFTGALVARTLPAFVIGLGLCFALLFAAGVARDAWLASLEPVVITRPATDGELERLPGTVATGWGWSDPSGRLITFDQALAVVPTEISANDDEQLGRSSEWLTENGYSAAQVGVSSDEALRWEWYDAGIFLAAGGLALVGAFVLLNRRRPT